MRSILRAAGLCTLAVVAITCTDAPTAPGNAGTDRSMARIGLAPSFSADAARAYGALTQLGFDVSNVRIRLTSATGTLAKDTVFGFPAAQDTLRMDLSVQMQGSEQTFTALIELRDASNRVLFSGTRLVTARAGSVPNAPSPAIALEYSGPGRDARSMSIAPDDITLSGAESATLGATALDANGRAVPDLLVQWTSSDATLATLTPTGSATVTLRSAGKRGTTAITATTPTGLTATTRVRLVPPATRLVVIGGAGQTGIAGRALSQPFVVELQAGDGGPVPNAPVSFRAVSGGAAVASTAATTDAAGRASTTLSLGRTAGSYTFEASSGALAPASISVLATPSPAAALAIVSGDGQTNVIGNPLGEPFTVRVTDELGDVVAGATVAWSALPRAGTLGAETSVSDARGLASTTYTLGTLARTDSVRARLVAPGDSSASVVFVARASAREPRQIWFHAGAGQSGTAGTVLAKPLVAFVGDMFGNPVPGVTVAWSSIGSQGSLAPITSTTDADGFARTTVTLPTTAGDFTVVATAGSLNASTTVRSLAGAATSFVALQSLPNEIAVGVPPTTSLRVQLADAFGNAVAQSGVVVTATAVVAPGGGAPLVSTDKSNAQGVVSFNLPSYLGPRGTATITLSAAGFTSLVLPPISIVTGPAALLSLVTQPSASAPSGTAFVAQPVVTITDGGANSIAVAGTMVTVFIASGGGVLGGTTSVMTNATGTAAFTDLSISGSPGLRTLGFSSGSLPSVFSAQIEITAPSVSTSVDAAPATAP